MEEPGQEDVYTIGTTAKIKQLLRLPGDTIRVLVEGLERSEILEYTSEDPYYEVKIKEHSSKNFLLKILRQKLWYDWLSVILKIMQN